MTVQTQMPRRANEREPRLIAVPPYLAFAGTGVGVALPGVILPALLQRWSMSDRQGGRLFLFAWIGSSLGALLARGSLKVTFALGCAAVSIGALALAFRSGPGLAYASMLAYGTGLGLVMTSISLIRQAASGERSGTELVRLNLLWSFGAFLCPMLARQVLVNGNVRPLLSALAVFFACAGAFTFAMPSLARIRSQASGPGGRRALLQVPLPLILMTILVTGVEASAGGWLATYARRSGESVTAVVAAPMCLWAGLLLSRLFWSFSARTLACAEILRGSALLMALASILIIAAPPALTLAPAAVLLGFGIGPVYPLLLNSVLRYTRSGSIFFLAGVGSAALPWLTGVVSTAAASLRTGLYVPVAGTIIIAALAVASPLRRWTPAAR